MKTKTELKRIESHLKHDIRGYHQSIKEDRQELKRIRQLKKSLRR
jgi:hypothetical protein